MATQLPSKVSRGLVPFGDRLFAVMLDRHGPNVVFSRHCDPARVIDFIDENFDLEGTTRAARLPPSIVSERG